jgi:predicted nucleic acid-binding protein
MVTLGLDTNIFIYHLYNHEIFGKEATNVFRQLETKTHNAITSIITLTELLAFKTPESEVKRLHQIFNEIPSLKIFDVDEEISLEAARIRRHYDFRLPDSIQLATSLVNKTDVFITNDKSLQKFRELEVKLLRS